MIKLVRLDYRLLHGQVVSRGPAMWAHSASSWWTMTLPATR